MPATASQQRERLQQLNQETLKIIFLGVKKFNLVIYCLTSRLVAIGAD